ncbi:MAG: phosphoglycerate kinase, partial [Parcubacteria group bacterium]|nr:phosphoglycerate kinase [Parcubacteria group bacterium]
MRHLDQAKVRGKTVLVRVDFNVSLRRGRVEDDARMRRTLPTVRWLLRRGAKVVLVSHLGRPKRVEEAFSLRPLARHLAGLLKMKVHFFAENPAILREVVAALPRGSVSLLENIRFWPGEEKNSTQLARALASLADIFVNDAFGVAHRKGASLIAITRYLPSYAGFLLIEELAALDKVRAARMRPFAMILGGAKLSDKLPLIHQFSRRVDYILTGGGVANTLAKAKGVNIAKSLYDPSLMKVAKQLLKTKKIFVPVDWKKSDGKILDIGPKSAALYAEKIRQANMILWNGPVG